MNWSLLSSQRVDSHLWHVHTKLVIVCCYKFGAREPVTQLIAING